MTREEAITRLKMVEIREALQEDYEAIDMAIEALSEQYKLFHDAYEQGRFDALSEWTGEWIPVSERLPSDGGNYLITVADLRLGHIGEHTVTMADFYAKEKKWNSAVDVYAWLPLPEPYKGGDSE